MPATNVPIAGVPSIRPSQPTKGSANCCISITTSFVTHNCQQPCHPVQIPPTVILCCVDGDEGLSYQIVVYKMNGMTPYYVRDNKKYPQ